MEVSFIPKMQRWLKGLTRILMIIVVFGGILFLAAGRINWLAAWILIITYFGYLLFVMIWGLANAPELLGERGRVADNVKSWDKTINLFYAILMVALLVVAGLDGGRWGWSQMAVGVQVAGFLGLILSGGIIWWTMAENAYLSRWARIQADRGQVVVTSGPYRYIRHPMYAAILLLVTCMALGLGSWWALIPAGMICGLFALRTVLEDRMLRQELPGYKEYCQRVRYRLLPGIW
jgi:protein-S-isoprenylcysteine O-methyltransferase Ste14